jgi:hypothetical protein
MLALGKWNGEFCPDIAQRNAELLLESHLPFKNWARARHPGTGKKRGENTMSRSRCKSDALPMG